MENNKQEAYGPWRSAWEQTWPLAKVSEVAHTLSFYPRGQYWAYFYSTGSGLWDTGRFLQNCHIWAWNLATAQSSRIEVVHTICFYPRGVKIEPIFPLRAEVFEIWADFQNCHIQAWNLWPKLRKLHIYYISAPGGWIWAYFCSEGSGFRDTGRFSKLPYLGMKLGHWPKCQKLYIYFLNYPQVPNFIPICSAAGHFQDIGNFSFPHWAQC